MARLGPTTPSPGGFNAIITAVHPGATDWVGDLAWAELLTSRGTLALITHCDTDGAALIDPTSRLIATLRAHRLGWLDYVILLQTPLDAADPDPPPGGALWRAPVCGEACDEAAGARPHRRVHAELLLFTHRDAFPPSVRHGGCTDA